MNNYTEEFERNYDYSDNLLALEEEHAARLATKKWLIGGLAATSRLLGEDEQKSLVLAPLDFTSYIEKATGGVQYMQKFVSKDGQVHVLRKNFTEANEQNLESFKKLFPWFEKQVLLKLQKAEKSLETKQRATNTLNITSLPETIRSYCKTTLPLSLSQIVKGLSRYNKFVTVVYTSLEPGGRTLGEVKEAVTIKTSRGNFYWWLGFDHEALLEDQSEEVQLDILKVFDPSTKIQTNSRGKSFSDNHEGDDYEYDDADYNSEDDEDELDNPF